jgi:hypothetical protein
VTLVGVDLSTLYLFTPISLPSLFLPSISHPFLYHLLLYPLSLYLLSAPLSLYPYLSTLSIFLSIAGDLQHFAPLARQVRAEQAFGRLKSDQRTVLVLGSNCN